MTLTIEISPEEKSRLREQARQRGEDAEVVAWGFVQAGLNALPAESNARDAFLRHLLEQGDINYIPQGRLGPPPRLAVVRGEPISETIIRKRGWDTVASLFFDSSGIVKRYVSETADRELNAAAIAEGLAVDDSNSH